MTDVERVARVSWESVGWHKFSGNDPVYEKWDDLTDIEKKIEIERAQAAIDAYKALIDVAGEEHE